MAYRALGFVTIIGGGLGGILDTDRRHDCVLVSLIVPARPQ